MLCVRALHAYTCICLCEWPGGVAGSAGPCDRGPRDAGFLAERMAASHGPCRCVLLPCHLAPVSGAFRSWHPLPIVQDTTGPTGPWDPGGASTGQVSGQSRRMPEGQLWGPQHLRRSEPREGKTGLGLWPHGSQEAPATAFPLTLSPRVSVPLSVLDPPHRYRIHRRKSFDASDTLALPRVSSQGAWLGMGWRWGCPPPGPGPQMEPEAQGGPGTGQRRTARLGSRRTRS